MKRHGQREGTVSKVGVRACGNCCPQVAILPNEAPHLGALTLVPDAPGTWAVPPAPPLPGVLGHSPLSHLKLFSVLFLPSLPEPCPPQGGSGKLQFK